MTKSTSKLSTPLIRIRNVIQVIGAIIMIPTIVCAVLSNIGAVDFDSVLLLDAIGVAIAFLAVSLLLSIMVAVSSVRKSKVQVAAAASE